MRRLAPARVGRWRAATQSRDRYQCQRDLGDKPRHGVCWYTSPAYDRWSEAGRHRVRYAVLAHSVRPKLLSAISSASLAPGLAGLESSSPDSLTPRATHAEMIDARHTAVPSR